MNNIPELRFPEFEGEWKRKKLGDIANGFSYGMNAAAKVFDGENQYLRITDIDEDSRRYINDSKVSPSGDVSDNYLLEEGDILFARTGASTGKTYCYRRSDGKLYYAGFLIRIKVNNGVDHRFVYYLTLTEYYKKWVQIMSMRSGQPGINAKEYSIFPIAVPSIYEQTKIANFLSSIDKKIEKEKENLEGLKEMKKGLMQKMFV